MVLVAAAVSFLALAASAQAVEFPDVASDDWFATAVNVLSDQGVVQGRSDGTFGPYETVSRAEFTVLLARSLGLFDVAPHPFVDVSSGAWYESAVSSLYSSRTGQRRLGRSLRSRWEGLAPAGC
jgi:hypothetical protein